MLKKNKHILKMLVFDMFVIEFGPIIVFFIVNYFAGFMSAALALAIATLLTMVLSKIVNKRVPWFAIFSGVITIVTSLVTYFYTAPSVLIIKDTVYYFVFAGMLLVGIYTGRSVFEKFFGHVFAITKQGWQTLEMRWCGFFVFAALSNEYVRIFYTAEAWVLYKQAILLVFFAFGMYQFKVSMKHRLPEADRFGLRKLRSQG
jgi:intracellular septation protein